MIGIPLSVSVLYPDLKNVYENGSHPWQVVAFFLVANVVLNGLNVFWFSTMARNRCCRRPKTARSKKEQ